MRKKVADGPALVAIVVIGFIVLIAFLGWRAYENTTRADAICGEVEQLRMNIRDFLEQETNTPPSTIARYFERVDCER